MQVPRIDPKNVMGLADKVVGLGKEILGTVTGQDRLSKAGQVQQDKGTERIKAVRAQMEAEGHQTKAKVAGQAQQRAQRTKERMSS
jgi:uncharacterized protein YjbJ (UPF0337 family)